MKNFIDKNKKIVFNLIGICILLLMWLLLSILINNELVIPKISSVAKAMLQIISNKKIFSIIGMSIIKIMIIMAVSILISLILAISSYKCKSFYYLIEPLISLIKTMPLITIIILIFMLFKMKYASLIATLLVSVPIIFEGIFNAFNNIDNDILDDVETLSNKKSMRVILNMQIPLTYPYIKTTFLQSFGLSFKIMLMAEYISPINNTLGAEMRKYYNNNQMEKVYCIVIISLIVVAIVDAIAKIINKKKTIA